MQLLQATVGTEVLSHFPPPSSTSSSGYCHSGRPPSTRDLMDRYSWTGPDARADSGGGGGEWVEARGCLSWPRILMAPVLSVGYTGASRCRVTCVSITVTRARTQHKISWYTFLDRLYLTIGQIWAEVPIYIGTTLINF